MVGTASQAARRLEQTVATTDLAPMARVNARDSAAAADRLAVDLLDRAVDAARKAGDGRSSLAIAADCLRDLGVRPAFDRGDGLPLRKARDDWLRRLAS